ncbi:hypothetical protein [Terrabacter koreensis]
MITTTTTTPSPTPTYASENQVASVIAGNQKTWREVEDSALPCRSAMVLGEDSGMSEIELITCYTNEVTAGVAAQNAIRDLEALDVPPSMEPLVDETRRVLQGMADVDLEKACGPSFEVPKDSKACTEALGSRATSYFLVSGVLDKWAPYL